MRLFQTLPDRASQFYKDLLAFPWKNTAITLRERFRDDRLGLTASSLTFTTTIALVPLITVALAVFSAFPMFAKFQDVLQKWLIESLIPENIARQVLGYLTQFAGKASRLGVAGVAVLFTTALALILTIDRTLNNIWRVRRPRALAQRVLVYWAGMTLGPLLLGASLTMTSYAISASRGVVGVMPGGVGVLLDIIQFVLLAGGAAALYHYVPNTQVKWSHAWLGGVFVSTAMELAKKLLALYLAKVPTYSVVYGALATVPILLVWIYVAWVIVLLGAVIAAYLPSLLAGVARRSSGPGWQFQLALEILQQLNQVQSSEQRGLTIGQLAAALRVDPLRLEPVLETLGVFDWTGRLEEEVAGRDARYVLLANPDATMLEPLMDRLLLNRLPSNRNLWESARWSSIRLRDVL